MNDFGTVCWTTTIAIKGDTSDEAVKSLVLTVIESVGMKPIFEPTIYQYENDEAGNEIGTIFIQPLYTSFVGFDVWPCHGGGFLTLTSCKPFSTKDVVMAVTENGYTVSSISPVTKLTL